jgi:hypothetical protein
MTKSLTEQWKKGWLDCGWYYVKGADGLFGMMSDYALYRVDLENPDNEISLLAKVPSYEEYSRLEWYAGCGPDRIVELNHENRKLKELLKECREVAEFTKTIVNKHKWFNEVITKIDKVLK